MGWEDEDMDAGDQFLLPPSVASFRHRPLIWPGSSSSEDVIGPVLDEGNSNHALGVDGEVEGDGRSRPVEADVATSSRPTSRDGKTARPLSGKRQGLQHEWKIAPL
jgi:hypothetical protein